jgi:hypothetical protein
MMGPGRFLAPEDKADMITMNFQRAKLFDGVDPETGPYFANRETITDPAERQRLTSFLSRGAVIRHAPGLMQDFVDRDRGEVVPLATVTDGTWIWELAVLYYLETYGYAPEPSFYRYIRSQDYITNRPDGQRMNAALEFLKAYEANQQGHA